MPKYVIEREIPGVGSLPPDQFLAISQKSCSVLKNLGPQIQWLESYVTRTKFIACISLPMKRWCGNMRSRAVSRRTVFRK